MADEKSKEVPPSSKPEGQESRFPELDELQREVDRRLRNNRRFLERFMEEDFVDEEEFEGGEEEENFEEL